MLRITQKVSSNGAKRYNAKADYYSEGQPGEHGWFDKRWIFEESLRTPLLVHRPGTRSV
jgi:hypothetical protein